MPLIEGYGLTEGGVVTLNPLDTAQARQHRQAAAPASRCASRDDGELLVAQSHACFPAT